MTNMIDFLVPLVHMTVCRLIRLFLSRYSLVVMNASSLAHHSCWCNVLLSVRKFTCSHLRAYSLSSHRQTCSTASFAGSCICRISGKIWLTCKITLLHSASHILNTLFSPCYVIHSLVGMGSVYLWRANQVFMRARCHVANNVSH